MKSLHSESSNVCASNNADKSLGEMIVDYAYTLLLSSRLFIGTKSGYLMHRKDARLILANNIKINRFFFEAIVSEMRRQGIIKTGNQGIYLKKREI